MKKNSTPRTKNNQVLRQKTDFFLKLDQLDKARNEKMISESRKRYEELWENAPVAYHILDKQGRILQVNKTEARMLGYRAEEMVGKPIFDFILADQRKEAKRRFLEKLKGKSLPHKEDRIYVKKDGTMIYVSIHDILEKNNRGKVIGVRTAMIDVTERKKAEEALRKSNELLIESYKHLGFINRKISLLLEMGKNYHGRKKNEVADYILSSAMNLARADAGLLYFFDEKKNRFFLVSQAGLLPEKQREARNVTGKACALLKNMVRYHTRMQGTPEELEISKAPLAENMKYILSLPLLKENKLEGVMLLEFLFKQNMETPELEFFDIFAIHASIALSNAGIIK